MSNENEDENEGEGEGYEKPDVVEVPIQTLEEMETEKEKYKAYLGAMAIREFNRDKAQILDDYTRVVGSEKANEIEKQITNPETLEMARSNLKLLQEQMSQRVLHPTGVVSLPSYPQAQAQKQGQYKDVFHLVNDLSQKAKKGDKQAKAQLVKLREIAKKIAIAGVSSGHAQQVLQIQGAYSQCPKCHQALNFDINVRGSQCNYCGFISGGSRLYKPDEVTSK